MQTRILFLIICLCATVAPVLRGNEKHTTHSDAQFPGWSEAINLSEVNKEPLTEREKAFEKGFPGRIARFTKAHTDIVVRWLYRRSRKLHPANDCFRGMGYSITPMRPVRDETGHQWSRFKATKGKESVYVFERIYNSKGRSWSTVSEWNWYTLWKDAQPPWWCITIISTHKKMELPTLPTMN